MSTDARIDLYMRSSRRFESKVVVITGATSGIGRATATEFAAEGAMVVVAGRREALADDVVREIAASGGRAVCVAVDTRDGASVQALIERTVDRFGRIDAAFNNAGIAGGSAPIADQTEANWDAVLDTNLKGVWWSMKYELREMSKTGGGTIVNNASDLGLVGSDLGVGPYVASKHGIVGLTRAAALEYAAKKIRVNAICPGYTNTEMIAPGIRKLGSDAFNKHVQNRVPIGRVAEPKEVARTVLWLCSEDATYITGQAISVDGGVLAK